MKSRLTRSIDEDFKKKSRSMICQHTQSFALIQSKENNNLSIICERRNLDLSHSIDFLLLSAHNRGNFVEEKTNPNSGTGTVSNIQSDQLLSLSLSFPLTLQEILFNKTSEEMMLLFHLTVNNN